MARQAQARYRHTPLFPLGEDHTPYEKLGGEHVAVGTFRGQEVLEVAPEALRLLAERAFIVIDDKGNDFFQELKLG